MTLSPRINILWRALFVLAALGATVLLTTSDSLWRLDTRIYDQISQLRTSSTASDSRILIVAIDEHSLAQIGQWPWSRALHAEAIRRLTRAGVQGVAIDLMFSETHGIDPGGDADLAAALAESTDVILPVSVARQRQHGPMIEVMPLPELARAASALGHTDLAEDRDGLTRGVFLRAGLGEARWSTLSLALLEGSRYTPVSDLPGLARPASEHADAGQWVRDRYVLLPFARPPGSFTHVSFSELISGDVPEQLLRDRYIFIGMAASGHGGGVRTPIVKGQGELRGIEFHAEVLKMLLDDSAVTPLTVPSRVLLSCLIVLLPFALYSLDSLRKSLILAGAATVVLLVTGVTLLFGFERWFAPAVPLLLLATYPPVLLAARLRRFQHMAVHDPMTGLANRRGFVNCLQREWRGAMRSRRAIALLLIDVDYFKAFNDRYGHRKGDEALRAIARVIAGQARRPRDLAARPGGEEFALLLPETGGGGAFNIAENLRERVIELELQHEDSPHGQVVTVSIGVHACVPAEGESLELLYDHADQALYLAKEQSRNRVCQFADIMRTS